MVSLDEILLINHSHTDIGYTHDQPTVWEIHRRGIDKAIELAADDLDNPGPDAHRWTVETSGAFLHWLDTATEEQVDRFEELEANGLVEVTGLLANNSTLYGPAELIESMEPVRQLRERYGIDVDYAMNSDVNGQNWPLADVLIDAGIEGFSMAINEHFGGAPERPALFEWEAPSGRTLRTWNGFHYATGMEFARSDPDRIRSYFLPRIKERLAEQDHSMNAVPLQTPHTFGDNGPPSERVPELVREWNAQEDVAAGELPRLRTATPSDWWEVVEEQAEGVPTWRGDWTDYWTFGPESAAREVAVHRDNRRRLATADAVEAGLGALGADRAARPPSRRAPADQRARAWWDVHFVDAHTWAPDTSIRDPDGEDTRAQLSHKREYVYDARSVSTRRRRDAVAELSRRVATGDADDE